MTMQTFTAKQYLMIDVAGSFGLDKEDWDTRLTWFKDNEAGIKEIIKRRNEGLSFKGTLIDKAESPAMFFAGIVAWDLAQHGLPIGYTISLDATASGAQLLALLLGCEASAKHCNLIDVGHRVDFYTNLYKALCERVENPGKITRSMAKEAMVPWFYGSEAEPKEVFGEGSQLMAFKATMLEEVPGINALRDALTGLWNSDADIHEWTLPDDFHAKIKVMDTVVHTVHFLNQPYQVTQKVNQPVEQSVSNAANIVHS